MAGDDRSNVRPIHFEDFSGTEFERLVFAYQLCDGWTDLAWFGPTGSDQGRNIIGTRPVDNQPDERTIISVLPLDHAQGDFALPAPIDWGKTPLQQRCVLSCFRPIVCR